MTKGVEYNVWARCDKNGEELARPYILLPAHAVGGFFYRCIGLETPRDFLATLIWVSTRRATLDS